MPAIGSTPGPPPAAAPQAAAASPPISTTTAGTQGAAGSSLPGAPIPGELLQAILQLVSIILNTLLSSLPGNGTPPIPGAPPVPAPVPGTPAPDTGVPQLQQSGGAAALNIFTQNDYANYLLAGSKGGTAGTSEAIESQFADPNSRFARLPQAQFDAAVAGMYKNQFKAQALGLPAAFIPGQTSIEQVSSNLVQAQNVQMTPEAETLSIVAATYRGQLPGSSSLYNNAALQQLLVSWGRNDLAGQPFVGSQQGDVQTIGNVVRALNEEPDPAIRQAWMQQIFDFAGNTPSSPSGAVPEVADYQSAINIVRDGTLDNLLNGFLATPGT